jgi:WD40 repeat protein
MAPVAVASDGTVAYLSAAVPEGKGVTVEKRAGGTIELTHDHSVTVVRFVSPDRLVVGTRAGELLLWALDGAEPVRSPIGHHEAAVVSVSVGSEGRLLAVDRDSIVRMWSLTTTSDDVGLRGFMEFPLTSFGVAGLDRLGTKELGFSGERLITINHHARGLFANAWSIPAASRLADEVARRMGPLDSAPVP